MAIVRLLKFYPKTESPKFLFVDEDRIFLSKFYIESYNMLIEKRDAA